jgi:Xaa-Pro aminopeptidase
MDTKIFIERRKKLVELVAKNFPDKKGSIILWANFEAENGSFLQEATFFYFTGITEPGVALKIALDGTAILYIPDTSGRRKEWVVGAFEKDAESLKRTGVDVIEYLGEPLQGYVLSPLFTQRNYKFLSEEISNLPVLFTCYPRTGFNYVQQVGILNHIKSWMEFPEINDVSSIVAQMRCQKSKVEIEQIFNAVRITTEAIVSVTALIKDGANERDVEAGLSFVIKSSDAQAAYPTIVATGKNASILHYVQNNTVIKKGELLLIDCGASVNHYCADISRTFPVSGKFTKRQRELYGFVLECQDYIASLVRPGIWLNNKENAEESLHHLAVEFFKRKGVERYFNHGIGHYLGLEPHDVGSYAKPLQEGDVIALEPGLYIPEENIGIRIEDNYWVIKDGSHCLSEDLPKAIDDIEALMKKSV